MQTEITPTPTPSSLESIAAEVRMECSAAREHIRAGLHHAVRAGNLLIQAKALVKHGEWLPWLHNNCEISERSAQAYMRVARRYPELAEKSATVADLTYREALHLLAEPKNDRQEALVGYDGDHEVLVCLVPSDKHPGFTYVAITDMCAGTVDELTKPVRADAVGDVLSRMIPSFVMDNCAWQNMDVRGLGIAPMGAGR